MAESSRSREQRCGSLTFATLPKDILLEILLLLPPKSIAQCRVVCKAWCAVTSDRDLLLAHHRRQPPRRLLTFIRDVDFCSDREIDLVDYCVQAVNLRTHEFKSIVMFTGVDHYDDFPSDFESPLVVHAACNGLLLMSYNNCLHLCNPTTCQSFWVSPPALQRDKVMGLYHVHGHSSKYRILYYRATGQELTFYTSTVGSGKERCISPHSSPATPPTLRAWLLKRLKYTVFNEPFLFHGNLHWVLSGHKNILMFNTVDEVFQWLPLPFMTCLDSSLLEIEGKLAMSNRHDESKVDLWLLQDYKHMVWVHKYRIELPVIEIRRFAEGYWCPHIVSEEGDVWINAFDWQLHYDRKGNLLEKFECDGRMVNFTAHLLQESLVPDAVFQNSNYDRKRAHHFFRGL